MRPKALAIVSTFVMLATSPAFAQMTEQNRQNQGSAANPLGESSVNHGAVTTGPAASAHAVPDPNPRSLPAWAVGALE